MAERVAVVTGGGGDMGVACARRLARAHRLLLAELDEERLARAERTLRGEGIEVVAQPLDVTDPASLAALVGRSEELGELGALVHTAGLSPSMAEGSRIWSVNLVGSARLMDAFRARVRRGSVAVLLASQAGHLARDAVTPELEALLEEPLAADFVERICGLAPWLASSEGAYGLSKYGVMRLALRESVPWGALGGRVVSLSPGIIDTGMGRRELASQAFMKRMIDETPLGRMGRAEEIASAVAFLCSEAASFVTGTDLLVDGGSTAQVRAILSAM